MEWIKNHKSKWVWYEMARRYVQFHSGEKMEGIRLWGLFNWGSISSILKTGLLVTNMCKENKMVWVNPSEEAIEKIIKPLIKENSFSELTSKAGWSFPTIIR